MTDLADLQTTVVIPHYDDLQGLAACLAALAAQTYPVEAFEIVVADNRSPCGIAAVEAVVEAAAVGARGGRARVIDAPARGAGPARNAGVAAARGSLLAFTDCDCVPARGWLSAGIAGLGYADIVGGAMTVSVADESRLSGAEAFERVFAFNNRRYVEEEGFSVTANLFCSRPVFDAVGPFLTGVSEDVEWCRRATAKGFTLAYAADAIVSHPARRNWRELKRKWKRINAERFALAVRAPRGRARWAAQTAMLPLSILAHAPRVLRSAALQRQSRWGALATLARLRCWRTGDALGLLFRGTRT